MTCMGRSRQDAGRETVAGPRDMNLLGSVGEVFWDSRANAVLIDLNQKEKGFGKLHRGLFKGVYKGKGRCSQRLLGRSHREFTFACDTADCYLRQALMGGASGSSRVLLATWRHKMDAEATISWSRLAQPPTQGGIKSLALPACPAHGLNRL